MKHCPNSMIQKSMNIKVKMCIVLYYSLMKLDLAGTESGPMPSLSPEFAISKEAAPETKEVAWCISIEQALVITRDRARKGTSY